MSAAAAAPGRSELEALYRRDNGHCNRHELDRLGELVAPDVVVDGEPRGLEGYVAGLEAVVRAFPDYRWDLRHLLVDGCWVSAHFIDTGTHRGTFLGVPATGRAVRRQEFAVYRFDGARIAEVWGTADNLSLLEQLP